MKYSFKIFMFASEVTRAVCPRCRGSMVGSGDQWKCEECPGTRKHTQVGGSRARRQNSDVQFHHFVWLHQLGAEVAEVMARIVAVSRKEVARLSNCWNISLILKLSTCHVKAECGDYSSSLIELGDCLTELHNLVRQPFRGLVVPEQVNCMSQQYKQANDHSSPYSLPPQLFWRALRMIRGNHRISA